MDKFEMAALKARQAQRASTDPAVSALADSIACLAEGLTEQAEIQRWILAKMPD